MNSVTESLKRIEAPSLLKGVALNEDEVTFEWTYPPDFRGRFFLTVTPNPPRLEWMKSVDGSKRTATIRGLCPDCVYTARLYAEEHHEYSEASNSFTFVTPPPRP